MKRFRTIGMIAILVVSILGLSSCDLFEAIFGGGGTTFELANRTGRPIMNIKWNGYDLGNDNAVYSNLDGMDVQGLQPGQNCICDVSEGEDHIRFSYADDAAYMEYRSMNPVFIEEGAEFFFELRSDNVVMN